MSGVKLYPVKVPPPLRLQLWQGCLASSLTVLLHCLRTFLVVHIPLITTQPNPTKEIILFLNSQTLSVVLKYQYVEELPGYNLEPKENLIQLEPKYPFLLKKNPGLYVVDLENYYLGLTILIGHHLPKIPKKFYVSPPLATRKHIAEQCLATENMQISALFY